MHWIDKAYEEIENEFSEGNITEKEYNRQLRELELEIGDLEFNNFDVADY